jgi:nitroreductase
MDQNIENTLSLIRARRSTKPVDLDNSPISQDLLRTLLEAASWAPTHGMREPWRFCVFSTPGSCADLAEFLAEEYPRVTPPAEQKPEKLQKLRETPLQASAVLVIGLDVDASGRIPEWEDLAAVASAVQNLHLAATAAGLGGYWSSPPAAWSPGMAEYCGWPAETKALGLFYLGWVREGAPQPRRSRRVVDTFTTWR